jgi:hypothetical protein
MPKHPPALTSLSSVHSSSKKLVGIKRDYNLMTKPKMIEKRCFIPIRSNKKPVEKSGSNTQEFSGRERDNTPGTYPTTRKLLSQNMHRTSEPTFSHTSSVSNRENSVRGAFAMHAPRQKKGAEPDDFNTSVDRL